MSVECPYQKRGSCCNELHLSVVKKAKRENRPITLTNKEGSAGWRGRLIYIGETSREYKGWYTPVQENQAVHDFVEEIGGSEELKPISLRIIDKKSHPKNIVTEFPKYCPFHPDNQSK